jgi:hypothetical protein
MYIPHEEKLLLKDRILTLAASPTSPNIILKFLTMKSEK